eukprot:scaffold5048_cov121-Cylindrotheca_fusiformis.AAC.24
MVTYYQSATKALPSSRFAKHQMKNSFVKKATKQQSPAFRVKSFVRPDQSVSIEFRKPTEKDISSYDLDVVKLIRAKDIDGLREMVLQGGRSMNACNQFGESLVHMVCRRGDAETLRFMINEARVSLSIKDDFGRNPFHDACWTPSPNFEIMSILLEHADTSLLLCEDVRGNTPFDYARREHYGKWIEYLEKNKDAILRGLTRVESLKPI